MEVHYKSFLEGLVDASRNLSTIKYGATEKVEGIPTEDKFLKLIILTTEVDYAYTGIEVIETKEYNDLVRRLFNHINTNFDTSIISFEEFNSLNSSNEIKDATLLKYLEILHPISAIRELLYNDKLRMPYEPYPIGWKKFSDNYGQKIISRG